MITPTPTPIAQALADAYGYLHRQSCFPLWMLFELRPNRKGQLVPTLVL